MKLILFTLAAIGVAFLVADFLTRNRIANQSKPLVSIAVLLPEVPDLNEELVARAVERALGVTMSSDDQPEAVADHRVAGAPPSILIWTTPYVFLLHVRNEHYLVPLEEAAAHPPYQPLKDEILAHTAWIALDFMEGPEGADPSESLPTIGKILAELSPDDALLIYDPQSQRMARFSPSARNILQSGDPLSAF